MKNKILDAIGFIIIIYGLSLGFTLLQSMLDVSNVYVIFIIKPVPYFLAIYMYLGIKQVKHDSNKAYALQHEELSNKDKQIANYVILDNVRITKERKLEKEITELTKQKEYNRKQLKEAFTQAQKDVKEIDDLKKELSSVAMKEKFSVSEYENISIGLDVGYKDNTAISIMQLEKDSAYCLYSKIFPQGSEVSIKLSDLIKQKKVDIKSFEPKLPFDHVVPYIGQRVRVLYADKFIVGEITTVLNERIIKYRVKGAGSRKYKISEMEMIG